MAARLFCMGGGLRYANEPAMREERGPRKRGGGMLKVEG